MSFEVVEYDGVRFAEIIWANTNVEISRFYSPSAQSFQFGLLAHEAGFIEPAHYHCPVERKINDLQQMFVVQKGKLAVEFFDKDGRKFKEVMLSIGDGICLINGAHAIRVVEDMQCISVKQGPFLGDALDKINIKVKN
jgi:anti-sigma factor ChrR (cupin superfamily)